MAAYRFEFDSTTIGDSVIERKRYETYQKALKILEAKLSSWNDIALTHGAERAPYEEEVNCLRRMIEWADERLSRTEMSVITVSGMSVGSVQLIKAALIHAAWQREKEIAQTSDATWPAAVIEASRGEVRRYQELAEKISYPPAGIINELRPEYGMSKQEDAKDGEWDAFISHASEDKEFVRPLADALRARHLSVWYDEFTLLLGDSLRRSIDRGLARSKYGIVILSKKFFEKEWPQKELDGLVAREVDGNKVILPVWYEITIEEIRKYSPLLADRLGVSSKKGISAVVDELAAVIRPHN